MGLSLGQFLWENDEQSGSGSLGRPTHAANLRIINITILVSHIHQLISKKHPVVSTYLSNGQCPFLNLGTLVKNVFYAHKAISISRD